MAPLLTVGLQRLAVSGQCTSGYIKEHVALHYVSSFATGAVLKRFRKASRELNTDSVQSRLVPHGRHFRFFQLADGFAERCRTYGVHSKL